MFGGMGKTMNQRSRCMATFSCGAAHPLLYSDHTVVHTGSRLAVLNTFIWITQSQDDHPPGCI